MDERFGQLWLIAEEGEGILDRFGDGFFGYVEESIVAHNHASERDEGKTDSGDVLFIDWIFENDGGETEVDGLEELVAEPLVQRGISDKIGDGVRVPQRVNLAAVYPHPFGRKIIGSPDGVDV